MTRASPAGPATWLPPLAALVAERLGLHYPPERWADLERGLRLAAAQAGARDAAAFAAVLLGDAAPQSLQSLAEALTVGETYFFRERRSFELLEQEILPPILAARRHAGQRLRLWSAGCATGEEAYSLAIVVDRLLPQRQEGQVRILATDLNRAFLRTAARAEFGDWSFRDAPPGFRERYFTPAGPQRWSLLPHIRRMVRFQPLNLVQDSYPDWRNDTHAMDLILCRNVLMYFSLPQVHQVLERLQRALADGGWLSVSAAEAPLKRLHALATVPFDGAVFYRKAGPMAAPAPAPPDPPSASSASGPSGALVAQEPPPAVPTQRPPERAAAVLPEPAAVAASVHPPAAEDLLRLARRQADAGQLAPALGTVERALLATAKLDAGAHHLHAVILEELGREAEARHALQRAIYLAPDFVLAHHALGQLARRQAHDAEAQRHFRNALGLLARLPPDAALPHADGLTAGHLRALVEAAAKPERCT
jgi:chemotaxis protein methyltransferase CheR